MNDQVKSAVSLSELARKLNLSRQRLYQLVQAGTFPPPVYDVRTRRPFYTEELQQICLDVRQHNFGVNGRPILFYTKGPRMDRPAKPTRPIQSPRQQDTKEAYPEIVAAIRALGLVSVVGEQVALAVKSVFPGGVEGVDQGRVIRSVFLHLQRKNRGDIVGR